VKKMFLFLVLLLTSFSVFVVACPTNNLLVGYVISGNVSVGFPVDSTIPATISVVGPPNFSLSIPSPTTSIPYSIHNVPAGTYSVTANFSTATPIGTIGVNETINGVAQPYFTFSPGLGSVNVTLMLSDLSINSDETININLTNAS
jgi:hypothetical protein